MKYIIIVLSLAVLISCSGNKAKKKEDTPTSGVITIGIDASLAPILDALIMGFEGTYPKATINPLYLSEKKIMNLLHKDSISLAVVTRPYSSQEIQHIESQKVKPKELVIGTEGVAIIAHRNNPDSALNLTEIEKILKGEIQTWKDLGGRSSDDIHVIFNHPDAAVLRFLHDSIYAFTTLPKNCFAVSSDTAVIQYVLEHSNALGLIGISWISDEDDPLSHQVKKKVRILAIQRGDNPPTKPVQSYIADGSYPLTRNIYMLGRDPKAGLATGFMAYAASEYGQRIILKAGLVPATMPIREIVILDPSSGSSD